MDEVTRDLMDFDKAMEKAEQFHADMKRAFRSGFDFLKAYYPPRNDDEYWKKLAQEARNRYLEDPDNELLITVLVMVMDYLCEEIRKTEKDGVAANG